ncbi:MAG: pyridoxamine 5'-phosphate oxidase family protein [Acidobacteriota bacterium]|nr:pyridoxamine 5'-phosphate oxidase family protein [Acidobacteriota bacterium]
MTQRTLAELNRDECLARLGRRRVGRLVYSDSMGPVAVPVNFALAGEDVVLRLEPTNTVLRLAQATVAFEVDEVDELTGEGWSVVVRGPAEEVDDDDLPALLGQLGDSPPRPWAEGVHNVWLRISTKVVTGRRLGGYATPLVM